MRLRDLPRLPLLALIVSLLSLSVSLSPACAAVPAKVPTVPYAAAFNGVYLYFSPNGNATAAIVEQIDNAVANIRVQAYYLTSPQIIDALVAAHLRGVPIEVVADRSQIKRQRPGVITLAEAGIPVWYDARHAIAHNKIILVDDNTIITGSFNFTKAAETANAENLVIIQNRTPIQYAYTTNFNAHKAHSIPHPVPEKNLFVPSFLRPLAPPSED